MQPELSARSPDPGWYLVLLIFGDAYSDAAPNRLIRDALAQSRHCAGVVVLTDRLDRGIDPRARQVPIPADFDTTELKRVGCLAVKLGIFDLDCLPRDATCLYVDLDSVITGNPDPLAHLVRRAPIWTIPVFPRPFSMLYRALWRLSGRRIYTMGNSSVFVYRNGFDGNPAAEFLRLSRAGTLAPELRHDDRFVAWCCQDRIRGLSTRDVVSFRFEFLAPTLWLADLFTVLRVRAREEIAIVTFAGPKTKPEDLAGLPEGTIVKDHHQRAGRWTDRATGGLRQKLVERFAGSSAG
jgi:hypothetical protein